MPTRRTVLLLLAALPCAAHAALAGTLGTVETTYNFHANHLAADPGRSFVYATTDSSLEIINSQTLAPVKSLPLPAGGYGMSLSADGSRLYVAGGTSNSVHVIDANTQTLLNTIPVAGNAHAVAAGLDNRLFVQTADISWPNSTILQIDATTGASRGPNLLGIGKVYDGDIQISPDRSTLYYGNFSQSPSNLYQFDVSTSTPQVLWTNHQLDIGSNGHQVVLSHDGSMVAYVAGAGYNGYKIPIFSTDDMSLKSLLPTGAYPNALAFSADDRWAFALHSTYPAAIDVYDTTTSALVGQFPALDRGSKMIVDRSGEHLFVSYDGTYGDVTALVAYSTGHFVPEPATSALAACAIVPLVAAAIRRSRKRARNA